MDVSTRDDPAIEVGSRRENHGFRAVLFTRNRDPIYAIFIMKEAFDFPFENGEVLGFFKQPLDETGITDFVLLGS